MQVVSTLNFLKHGLIATLERTIESHNWQSFHAIGLGLEEQKGFSQLVIRLSGKITI